MYCNTSRITCAERLALTRLGSEIQTRMLLCSSSGGALGLGRLLKEESEEHVV